MKRAEWVRVCTILVLTIAMAIAVCYDTPELSPHSGGVLSFIMIAVTALAAIIWGINAVREKRWSQAVLMTLALIFSIACGWWIDSHTPPCADCDPELYAEWREDTNKG